MAKQPNTPTATGLATQPPQRRHFCQQLALGALGLGGVVGAQGLAAQDRLFANPWLKSMQRSLGDNTQVALLWWTVATQAQRAAATAQCALGRRSIADMEWDMQYQISIDQDARQFHQLPVVQQNFVQPWAQAAEAIWQSMAQIDQARWRLWLNADVAAPVFNSLRAEEITMAWSQANWPIDPTTSVVVASPMVLAAHALRALGMHTTVTQVIRQLDVRTAQLWMQLRPLDQMGVNDRPWLHQLAGRLQQLAPAITDGFTQTANQQWPERGTWLQSMLGTVPAQCGFVTRGVVAAPMLAAAFVPTTLGRYCGMR